MKDLSTKECIPFPDLMLPSEVRRATLLHSLTIEYHSYLGLVELLKMPLLRSQESLIEACELVRAPLLSLSAHLVPCSLLGRCVSLRRCVESAVLVSGPLSHSLVN
eukprot:1717192-Amphidinium_carterae.1